MPDASEARLRILNAAERLFAEQGYAAMTLREIAVAVGIRHASLYHHFPGGKEQLFIEVTERHLGRHQAGMLRAITQADDDLRAQLYAIADWLMSQPPMDLVRLVQSDFLALEAAQGQRLGHLALQSLIDPIAAVLADARARGDIAHPDVGLVAGGVLGMLESLFSVPEPALVQPRATMARTLIDVILRGLEPRG